MKNLSEVLAARVRVVVCFVLCGGLLGCDQLRDKVGDVIQPRSAKQVLDESAHAYSAGQYQKAIEEAQPFAAKGGEFQSQFAMVVARAQSMSGNGDQALAFLALAAQSGPVDLPALMVDPAFEPIRTDARFVAFVAGISAAQGEPSASVATPSAAAGDAPGVSVRVGPDGASATAGGVTVRVNP